MTASDKKCPVDHKLLADQQKGQAIARGESGTESTPADPSVHPHTAVGECKHYLKHPASEVHVDAPFKVISQSISFVPALKVGCTEPALLLLLKSILPAGQCPVDHKSLAEETGAAPKCPVDHANMNGGQQKQQECPVDHSAMSALPGGLKENGKPPKAVCPFGFGSSESGGPTMTSLHCPK